MTHTDKTRGLAPVLLATLLTVAALALLLRLPDWLSGGRPEPLTAAEHGGVYDLTGASELTGRGAELPPGPSYYPNQLLTPETADAAVPASAALLDTLRADYLSQRFRVLLPEPGVYALTFRLSGRHAMRVYVNGALAGEAGRVGETKAETQVWENNFTVYADAADGKMDILLQSAQFYHYRSGATLATLTLQSAAQGALPRLSGITAGFVVMGALLCAAALLLAVYLLLLRAQATLWFALACLAMVLREWVQSQAWTYFPVSGSLTFMLEYMSVVLLTVLLCLYLTPYAATPLLRGSRALALTGSAAYGALLLVADSVLYTRALVVYQLVLIAAIIPGIGGLFWHLRRPNREQAAALYGIGVFYLAALIDILRSRHLLGLGGPTLSETAMLVFVVAQAVSLFLMNNRVLAEARRAEQALAAEKAALESLSRMKTEFLGNVSHELKTPLTVMSGYAQTTGQLAARPEPLDRGLVSDRMRLISAEAERLSLMVGQLLDVTRMEEGRMSIELRRCYVDEVIHQAVETHYPMLNKNDNRLEIRLEPGLPPVNADPERLAQVIVNLLSNAGRFTRVGLITVSAVREAGRILVRVADTGSGIDPELLPHLFRRYETARRAGGTGTGLGLYICKHIVEAHGGTIWAENGTDGGACVSFTLPAP